MSQLTANTLMPLFSALTEEQQRVFAQMANDILAKKSTPKKKNKKYDVYDKVCEVLGEKFRPENKEMLISEIMNGI